MTKDDVVGGKMIVLSAILSKMDFTQFRCTRFHNVREVLTYEEVIDLLNICLSHFNECFDMICAILIEVC